MAGKLSETQRKYWSASLVSALERHAAERVRKADDSPLERVDDQVSEVLGLLTTGRREEQTVVFILGRRKRNVVILLGIK